MASVNRRLSLTVILATGVVLGLACVALLGYDYLTLRGAVSREARTLAEVVGLNAATALTFDDAAAATETLDALGAARGVLAAAVYDREGQKFAQFLAPGQSAFSFPPVSPPSKRMVDGELEVFRAITFGSDTVGTIYVRRDTKELADLIPWFVGIVVALLATVGTLVGVVAAGLRRHISVPLEVLVADSGAIAAGDLTERPVTGRADEIGALAQGFEAMRTGLRELVREVRRGIEDVSLVVEAMKVSGGLMGDEASRQKQAISETARSLEQADTSIVELNDNIEQLAGSARDSSTSILQIDESFGGVVARMNHQAASIDATLGAVSVVATTIDEVGGVVEKLHAATEGAMARLGMLRGSVDDIRHDAEASHGLSEDASQEAGRGIEAVNETIHAIGDVSASFEQLSGSVAQLAERSGAIDEIVGVIRDFTDQTNLLSLNASIIAAQAGEQGQAFSVVADEVKSLADRTKGSAAEIAQLVRAVVENTRVAVVAVKEGSARVDRGVQRSRVAGDVLREISDKSTRSTRRVHQIVEATVQQGANLMDLDRAMRDVKDLVAGIRRSMDKQRAAATKITEASEEIRSLGEGVRTATEEQRRRSGQISAAVREVAATTDQIAEATRAQMQSRGTIQQALQVFRDVGVETDRWAVALAEMVARLSEHAGGLEQEIGRFKIDDRPEPEAAVRTEYRTGSPAR